MSSKWFRIETVTGEFVFTVQAADADAAIDATAAHYAEFPGALAELHGLTSVRGFMTATEFTRREEARPA